MHAPSSQDGFSLVETMIALGVLTVGVLGAAGVLTTGMQKLSTSPGDVVVMQKATEAIEAVFSARDSQRLAWSQLQNVIGAGSDGGVFLDGPQPLHTSGPDGLVNTTDDDTAIESVVLPGHDQLLGVPWTTCVPCAADDITLVLTIHPRDQDPQRRGREQPAPVGHRHDHLPESERVGPAVVHADHLHVGVLIERATHVHTMSREHGFTLAELMISMTVTLIAVAAALTTFSQGLIMNDSGTQLSDANQNLRAGANQLMQDLMQAGRIIGPGGIPVPTGLPGSVGWASRPSTGRGQPGRPSHSAWWSTPTRR